MKKEIPDKKEKECIKYNPKCSCYTCIKTGI